MVFPGEQVKDREDVSCKFPQKRYGTTASPIASSSNCRASLAVLGNNRNGRSVTNNALVNSTKQVNKVKPTVNRNNEGLTSPSQQGYNKL